MSQWWTYTVADFLLFSPQTYWRLVERYQRDVWPLQPPMLVLGGVVALLMLRGGPWGALSAGRIAALILAVAWVGVAWAFHIERYATINWAAPYFAAAFIVQAAWMTWTGFVRNRWTLGPPRGSVDWVAIALIAFALVGEPLLGRVLGRAWPQVEVFGITPDATVLATLGAVLMARRPAAMVLPVLWCIVSGALLWAMEAPDALVAPIAALVAPALALTTPRGPLTHRAA